VSIYVFLDTISNSISREGSEMRDSKTNCFQRVWITVLNTIIISINFFALFIQKLIINIIIIFLQLFTMGRKTYPSASGKEDQNKLMMTQFFIYLRDLILISLSI